MNGINQVMDVVNVMEPAASAEFDRQMVVEMRKAREAMCPVNSFLDVEYREVVDKHKPTHEESLLNSVALLL